MSNPTSRLRAVRPALRAAALTLTAAALVAGSTGQFIGLENKTPWKQFKLNAKTRLKLDYRNANVDAIIAMYQRASGVTIVKDPSLTGGLSISSAKAVPLDDAFQILATTLSLKGYDMSKDGNLLVIKKRDANRGWTGAGGPGGTSTIPFPTPEPDGDTSLRVYPIQYANASQIAKIINDVFADSGNQGFGGFRFGDNGAPPMANNQGNGNVQVEAGVQFGRGGGGGGGQRPGGGGGFQFPNRFNFGRQNTTLVKASSDDYSNQVIVSAPERFQSQVSQIIKQLDKLTDTPVISKVYKLQYAAATDAQSVVQNVLNANVPRGRGGATTSQNQGPGAFFNALRGQQTGSGTAVADTRTNSLVVTATPENLKTIDSVVAEIDRDVPVESTTFVFQLENAKAEDVANLLQSAFGTRTGVNGARTNFNNTNRNNNNTNRNNTNRNNTLGGGLNSEMQGNEIDMAMADPNSEAGALATSVGVTQNFGQNFFGGQNRTGTNSQQTFGRGPNGQVVNTRDLSNQVTAIADQNTNSIIVVTSPENAAIIRSILDQLDKIPEQVMIETIITEASLTAADKLGVEWNFTDSHNKVATDFNNIGAVATSTVDPEGFRYTLTNNNFSVFLNALRSDNKFQVLSTPRIFTSNNVEAVINISQSIPYITNSRQDANGNFTYNYQFRDVGVVLTVTPRITSNGMVTMEVDQTANDFQGYTDFNAPIIQQRQATTTVSVKDGETIVLGGIIRRQVTTDKRKIPLLGDIPLLGQLFRSTTKNDQKTELLVFLTPRIVRDPEEARKLREDTVNKMSPETQKGLQQYQQKGNNDKTPLPVAAPDKKNGGTP